ncbi:flavonol synthase/flavanone 3-hydroxylase [Senna tora]|uniref:Flavonol synthase/flavanone 3-hydroxylase n=1 Tax=Senna tora TaxID=362788 RepID=A0A834WXA5_9FABA|nr:flavonol synthase/flavanone 3-hydroxylase [Senna tora]
MEVERVQAIATLSKGSDTIPPEFVRPETEQPGLTTFQGPAPSIPTIDLAHPDQAHVVALIADASKEWGLFQVVNHGIPSELLRKLQSVGKQFFELPQQEKEKYAKPPNSFEGYGTKLQKDAQGKKAWVDHLFHKVWPESVVNYQFWPREPEAYKEVNEEYAKCVREVGEKLLKYLSLGLEVEENALKDAVGGEALEYMMKINYYPPCPRPDLALGVTPHTDLSAITILLPNEVPGLQVLKDGRWIDAHYIPNALIIHIGDQIQILSNGKYKSVMHRTKVEKERTRMSWPVFLEPPGELEIGPLPQLVTPNNPPKYNTWKFKDYIYRKLNKLPLDVKDG